MQQKIDLTNIETETSLIKNNFGQLNFAKASIIYLPGFGCDFSTHESFKNLLTSYDYYAINFPSQGNSIWTNANDLTITHFANIVVEFINQRNLRNVIIIGHGSSAAVATIVSKLLPNVVKALVLVSPIELLFQKDAPLVKDILIPRLPKDLEQLNALKVFNYDLKCNSPAWKAYNQEKLAYFNKNYDALSIVLDYLISDNLKASIEETYKVIDVPTLLVFGDSDGLMRLDEVLKKAPTLVNNNAGIVVIPISGHEPALDNPMNYYSNVINFIDQVVYELEFNEKE